MSNQNSRPNAPATVAANALLMQNYTIPSVPLGAWKMFTVGHEVGEHGKTQIHLFGVPNNESTKVYHVYKNYKSETGWTSELFALPSSSLYVYEIVCGIDPEDGKSVVFIRAKDTSDNNYYKVYYQKNGTNTWTQVGRFSGSSGNQCISAGQMNGKLVLMASYYKSGNQSLIQQIDWKNNSSTWTDISNTEPVFYSIDVGSGMDQDQGKHLEGVWASVKLSSGEYKLQFYDGISKSGAAIDYSQKTSHYSMVQAPPASGNYKEAFGLREDGKLQDVIQSNGRPIFSNYSEIQDFTVVQPNLEFTVESQTFKDDKWHAFGVTSKKQLLHSYLDPDTKVWQNAIPFMENITALQSIVTKDFVSVFVMNSDGNIIELQREAMTSEWRKLPVYVAKECPTKIINDVNNLTVGISQAHENGIPTYHIGGLKSSNGYIHRYSESNSTPQDICLSDTWSLPNGKEATQIISASDVNGQTVFFVLDNSLNIYYRRMDESEWTKIFTLNSNGTSRQKIAAGVMTTNGKTRLKLLASYTGTDANSNVILINWENLEGNYDGGLLINNIDAIYDISIGKTSLGDGFFLSLQDNSKSNKYSVQFYQFGDRIGKQLYCETDSHHYKGVYGVDANDRHADEVFVVDYDSNLSYISGCGNSAVSSPLLDSVRDVQTCLPKKDDTLHVLSAFVTDTSNNTHLFQLSNSNVWSSVQIAKNMEYVALGCNPWTGRYQYCFGNSPNGNLMHLYSEKWGEDYEGEQMYKVTESISFEPEKYVSYTTEVTVGDLNGVGVAAQKVNFLPLEDTTRVDVNGIIYYLSPTDKPLSILTNGSGKATFTVIASNLHTPQMKVWADFMDEGDCLVVQPNAEIQEYLANIDEQELQDAQKQNPDGTTSDLFSDPSVVTPDFTEAVNTVMSMAQQPEPESQRANLDKYISPRCNRNFMSYTTHEHAQELMFLNPEVNKDRHFQIEFIPGGSVKFHHLTAQTAQKAIENAKKGIFGHPDNPTISKSSAVTDSDSPKTIQSAFGDVFASINDDISTDDCQSITITSVPVNIEEQNARGVFSRIKATVNFIKDGISYIWEGFINLVEDTFDVLQSIFAHVKVFFNDLFEWLGSFFWWKDVLNTQAVLLEMINGSLNALPNWIQQSKGALDQLFAEFSNVPTTPQGKVEEVTQNNGIKGGNEVNSKYGNPGMAGEDTTETDGDKQLYGDDPQGNWFITQVTNAIGRIDTPIMISPDLEEAVAEFMEAIKDIVNIDTIIDDFQPIYDLFLNKEGDAGIVETMQTTMNAVSNTLVDMLHQALDVGGEFFVIMVEKVSDILNSRIVIPLITPLYETIINPGAELTVLNLVTLTVAVPATLGYKFFMLINHGQAYAPVVKTKDDIQNSAYQVALDEFSASYVTYGDWLNDVTDAMLKETQITSSKLGETTSAASYVVSHVTGIAYSFCYIAIGAFDFFSNGISVFVKDGYTSIEAPAIFDEDKYPKFVKLPFDTFKFIAGLLAQGISSPVYPWDTFPEKGTVRRIEFIIWCCQWTFPLLDIAGFICEAEGSKKGTALINGLTSLAGAAHMGSFIYLAIKESEDLDEITENKFYHTSHYAIKTTQNVLSALGETLTYPKVGLTNTQSIPPQDVLAILGVYDILCFESVAGLNLARAIWSLIRTDIHDRHLNL